MSDLALAGCACVSADRYACWRMRYGLSFQDSVEDDGGPCECRCHDEEDGDDDWF